MPITPQVIDETSDKKYFSIIPHYITNHSSHWEQSLYLQMKRVSGETGKCFVSQKGLAKRMGCSQQTVSKVLRRLVRRGWIKQEGFAPGKTRPVKRWTLVDLWKFNNNHYKKIDTPQSISPTKAKDSDTTECKIYSPRGKEEEHKIRRKITTKVVMGGKPQPDKRNALVDLVIKEFDKVFGFPPIDRKPRFQAYNLIQRFRAHFKQSGKDPTNERLEKAICYYFRRWVANQDSFENTKTLDNIRRNTGVFFAELKKGGRNVSV